jgi:subtilisin family serine protease
MSRPGHDNLNPVVVLPVEVARRPEEIHRLNDVLASVGLDRALGTVVAATSSDAIVSVTGDPRAVCEAFERERSAGNSNVPAAALDQWLEVGTDDSDLTEVQVISFGKVFGHGVVGWTAVPPDSPEAPADPLWISVKPWERGQRPVVAMLDTAVDAYHPWLRGPTSDPILIDAEDECWTPSRAQPPDRTKIGTHSAHGTFIAGLIRAGAPHARLLSVRVMNDEGKGSEFDVLAALTWLAGYEARGNRVDVVLLALGRECGRSESDIDGWLREQIGAAIGTLAQRGVRVVISAGNCEKCAEEAAKKVKTYPAAYALDHSFVVSVGSGTPHNPDDFSRRGDESDQWVEEWAAGREAKSIVQYYLRQEDMVPGFGKWNGTSFSAARWAAKLANELWQGPETPGP